MATKREDLFMSDTLTIETLVRTRSNELGLVPIDLVRRSGYKKVTKGLRRLEELQSGFFDSARGLLQALPAALDLPEAIIQQAVEDSLREIVETKEATWRTAFVPHAIILTERARSQPIFIAAMIGIAELKRVDFTLGSSPVSYIQQALEGVRHKLNRGGRNQLPCFGRPVGIVINYTPDWAVRFDLYGKAVESFDTAYRLGEATLSIRGRAISPTALRAVLDGSGRT